MFGKFQQPRRVRGIARALGGGLDQRCALHGFAPQRRNASLKFGRELALPSPKCVGPCFDGVFVDGVVIKRANTAPAVVIDKDHGRLPPLLFSENSPLQDGRDNIVPVLENVRLNNEIFANDAFYWISPAIDQWLQVFDDRGRKGPRHGP